MADVTVHGLVREREISREQFDALQRVGTVIEARVRFPRADRYGHPQEATPSGLLEWIELEHSLVTCGAERFRSYFEDFGDDPADCFLRIWLPKGAFGKIFNSPSKSDELRTLTTNEPRGFLVFRRCQHTKPHLQRLSTI